MQIYHSQHYTTLITDNDRYYHYDGLGMPVPHTITLLHNRIRQWYGSSPKPPALQDVLPTGLTPYTPQQTDGWNCAMHMLLTFLSVIYKGQIPILQYGQHHVDQMSRMHLRYVLTREITPWIDNLTTYITDPLNNEDPETYSKSYNAGGTEMPNKN
jgi:hypothetical protein